MTSKSSGVPRSAGPPICSTRPPLAATLRFGVVREALGFGCAPGPFLRAGEEAAAGEARVPADAAEPSGTHLAVSRHQVMPLRKRHAG